jgi:ADP-heptose:LPS heptosyltransferase
MRALADAFPNHWRVLVAPTKLASLARSTGAVDAVFPASPLALWRRDGSGPDLCVNLQSRSFESYRLLLATRPSRLIGFANPEIVETGGFPALEPGEHEVHRWCRLLEQSGIPADEGRLDIEVPPGPFPEAARGATLLHPGASDPHRRWPVEHWGAVATAELAHGRRIVMTGSTDEEDLGRDIARRAGIDHGATWLGGTDVLQLARLVSVAARTVSSDTGLAHLATALRTPSVVMFGARQPPSRWGPPPDRPWHRVLWHDPDRSPVGGIEAITVDEVLGALEDLPPATPAAAWRPPNGVKALMAPPTGFEPVPPP